MRILIISNYYYPEHIGGVELVSHNLAKHYRSLGNEVRWMAADVPPKFRNITPGDVPVLSWNITEARLGFPSPLPGPEVLPKLYASLRWCDVVHLQDSLYPMNILAFAMLKAMGKPVLITQHAKIIPYRQLYKRLLQASLYATVGQRMFRAADKLVFMTTNVRAGMQHITPDQQYDVVPLGVDTDYFSPLPEPERQHLRREFYAADNSPVLLFVGRMVERKGVHLIRQVIEKNRNWQWVLVGRPDDFDPAEWKLPNLVYHPNVSEESLHRLYAISDLLIHPSQGEGLTLTASESMACGTPVVISKESMYEISDVDAGLFLPVSLSPDGLEQGIAAALSHPEHLRALRSGVREFAVQRLSWRRVARAYLEILEQLPNSRSRFSRR